MKKIIICVITFIVSITAGVGSFAVNDLGSYQQWMDDNRPLIKANLHKDKSHKENKHRKTANITSMTSTTKRINTRNRKNIFLQKDTIGKTAMTGKVKTILMKNGKNMKSITTEM